MKKIEMIFENGGRAVAELLEKEAPKTCKKVWGSLPIEAIARPAKAYGEVYFVSTLGYIPVENVHEEGSEEVSYSVRKQYFAVVYAKGLRICPNRLCSTFGKLTEGAEELVKVRARLRETRMPEKITVRKLEGA